jgi:hypothetical protein
MGSAAVCPPPNVRVSLFTAGRLEADKYKWIVSQQAGKDLGESAVRQWVSDHWWGFLRHQWIEHIQGACWWNEFKPEQFGLLRRREFKAQQLLQPILDRIKRRQENLDIIQWALSEKLDMEDVYEILEAFDINEVRINPEFALTNILNSKN